MGGIGNAIDALWKLLLFLIIFALPLAIWKLVEIIIWIYNHISFSIK